ncbi:hypothetical protein ASG76_05020 [Nocardioides sp. Soil774]|uniref:hypothetical protein n=1 Tax=Nocardioides sp. Soil774 TaxID=1736408 RepID=UPI0006FCADA9|nr:hypothetical protein [Nocardioides sp. Soil774]KRE95056.1 hypothetical protein ASG76_05020 [Nocardioides sp. Soil774]
MDVEHSSGTAEVDLREFVVRPDATVVGDDGVGGVLVASLTYAGRLARRVGELVGVGDLRSIEVVGRRRLTVGVTWTPAGEGTYRAVDAALPARLVPAFTVVGAVDTSAAVGHCLTRVLGVEGVRWAVLVLIDSRVVAAEGERHDAPHLAEAGNRVLAVLGSLGDRHATGFVRLGFEQDAVVGAQVGRHALVVRCGATDDAVLLAVLDEVRAVLAGHDLSLVPPPAAPEVDKVPAAAAVDAPVVAPPPLVGARFGGGQRAERPRRGRFAR